MVDSGTIWDWQGFFWQVWATGTNKIEIGEIIDLWPLWNYGQSYRQWGDINANAATKFGIGSGKLTNFRNKAYDNGIDH
jgi:hypothetical protein